MLSQLISPSVNLSAPHRGTVFNAKLFAARHVFLYALKTLTFLNIMYTISAAGSRKSPNYNTGSLHDWFEVVTT